MGCSFVGQALESEAVMGRFHAICEKLHQVLDGMPYDEIGISDEVKEQVSYTFFSQDSSAVFLWISLMGPRKYLDQIKENIYICLGKTLQ